MPLLCIVPTALRAARVSRRLCDAQEGVLFGRQAITFDGLAAALVAASADRRPVLGPLGERLLAVEAGREAGGPFASLSPADGLAGALAAVLAELRRGEVSAADAREAAATLDGAPRARLEAVARALAAWERRLDAGGLLDGAGALRAAADAARRGARIPETEAPTVLLLDGFTSLSPAEWEIFTAVAARAGSTRVHLPHFADQPRASAAEPLARRLESLHELAALRAVEVLHERTDDPARAPRLAALLAAMAGGEGAPPPPGGGGIVRAVAAAGEEGEARAVAAAAAEWIEAGFAPADLRVFSPSPRADGATLARAFAEVGVPFATGRGPALLDVPVIRLVREALRAAGGLSRRSAERLAGSTYLSLREPIERLPALLDRAGALDGRAAPGEALARRAASLGAGGGRERRALGRAAGGLEALRRLLAPLDEPGPARRHAARLAALLDAAGIRRRAGHAEPVIAARDLAALSRLETAAEEVARALALLGRGEERLRRGEWLPLLDVALGGASVPPSAEPFAGAVELCGLDDAPGEAARGALLYGCGRGRFPAAPSPEPLLREPERRAIDARAKRAAVATAAARRAASVHGALCAAAAAREAILFTWRADEDGLSPIVEGGLAAAGVVTPPLPAPAAADAGGRTERGRLRAAARRPARAGIEDGEGGPLDSRLASARARGEAEAERRRAVEAREASPFAGAALPADLAPRLPAEWTPSQLEEYARCPFRLLVQLGVGLPRAEAAGVDIDARDEGSLLHAALERWVAERTGRGAWPPTGGEADRAEAAAVVEALFASFGAAGRTGDPSVWAARREAVKARLVRWIEVEAGDADGLVPRLLEHRFGGDSGRPPLRFGEGEASVAVQGRIDRVDADATRLRVLDYKNARATSDRRALLEPESFGVTSFQVPVYLAAAARDLPGRDRLEATFALLRDGKRLPAFEGDAGALAAELGSGPLADGIVGTVGRARAGRFPIVSRDCERCDFGAVCRFQGVAEIEEGEERRS